MHSLAKYSDSVTSPEPLPVIKRQAGVPAFYE